MKLICCRCGTEKEIDMFVKASRNKLGVTRRCKSCHREISKKSVSDNPESRKRVSAKYYQKNKEAHAERVKNWVALNTEKIKVYTAEYRIKNADKIRSYTKEYISKHGANRQREGRLRHPNRYKARNAVNNAVARNKIPKVTSCICQSCGSKAENYHHHKGYDIEHWLDVVPLCRKCHKD